MVCETLSQKNPPQKGLVEWLKIQALSSSPNTANNNNNNNNVVFNNYFKMHGTPKDIFMDPNLRDNVLYSSK
jgi:hypothetical protein